MDEKIKAIELVDLFYRADEVNTPTGIMEHELAKQCALRCCDVVLEVTLPHAEMMWDSLNWKKVKTEIKKL